MQEPFPSTYGAKRRAAKELEWVNATFPTPQDLEVERVHHFVETVPPKERVFGGKRKVSGDDGNPQTVAFCEMLAIENRIRDGGGSPPHRKSPTGHGKA